MRGRDDQLTPVSEAYLRDRCPDERRTLGQYLTPRALRQPLLDQIPFEPGMRVLDPGAGTGEFLLSVREREPTVELVGWDVDPRALEVARRVVPEATLDRRSALDADCPESFDVVVGNPPYFQLTLSPHDRRRFEAVICGRPNIFALFFHVGLEVLKPGGWLGFVVPPSMNNGAYFQALRDYIQDTSSIEYLTVYEEHSLFDGARTAVQLLVLRKGGRSRRYVFDLREITGGPLHRTVFSEKPAELAASFAGRSTLWELGYKAVTGTVVWNDNRDRLRSVPGPDAVPLVWAHNIDDGRLRLCPDHPRRPQYVVGTRPLTGPAIVVNRVVGSVGSAVLRCAPIEEGRQFVGENHVNVVVARPDVERRVGWTALRDLLSEPGVNEYVIRLTGNTQISATELTHVLPLSSAKKAVGAAHSAAHPGHGAAHPCGGGVTRRPPPG